MKSVVRGAALGAVLMSPQLAFAADGTEYFCAITKYFKNIVGGAALVALLMERLQHGAEGARLPAYLVGQGHVLARQCQWQAGPAPEV